MVVASFEARFAHKGGWRRPFVRNDPHHGPHPEVRVKRASKDALSLSNGKQPHSVTLRAPPLPLPGGEESAQLATVSPLLHGPKARKSTKIAAAPPLPRRSRERWFAQQTGVGATGSRCKRSEPCAMQELVGPHQYGDASFPPNTSAIRRRVAGVVPSGKASSGKNPASAISWSGCFGVSCLKASIR